MRGAFTETRVVRVIGSLVFLIGVIVSFFVKIFEKALVFADSTVLLATQRYTSFTGKIALKTFKEDQELWKLLNQISQDLLPIAKTLVPIGLTAAILIMCLGVLIMAFPRYFGHLLVIFKVLKRVSPTQEIKKKALL
ncbi:MAG: hypothetical protein GX116_09000 [Fibrobacter sp.]|jgi:hypothetical protein|nr:hypothetical protein [Fibrobacter sp.]